MKPLGLDWLQSATIGKMLIARRGVFKCFVWESADRGTWVWEIDIADQPVRRLQRAGDVGLGGRDVRGLEVRDVEIIAAAGPIASGFANGEQEAKVAVDQYLRAVGNAILGDGAK